LPSAYFDLGYLSAGMGEIEPFLFSKHLFWPLHGSPPYGEPRYPRLTLGGLLLSQARLGARKLSKNQVVEFESLQKSLLQWRETWQEAWIRKAENEYISRFRQWKNYLADIQSNPDGHIPFYGSEVRIRLILDLLNPEIRKTDQTIQDNLRIMDEWLKSNLEVGEFILDSELSSGFDSTSYWYLWGWPKTPINSS
jgi:hypothetical protein